MFVFGLRFSLKIVGESLHNGFCGWCFCCAGSRRCYVEDMYSLLAFEMENQHVGVTIKRYSTDNGVYTIKELAMKLQDQGQQLRLSGVGAHHQNGPTENAIKNVPRIFMFHAALGWPSKFDKSLWPLAMNQAVHMHNHAPRLLDNYSPIELWTGPKSTYSELTNIHPFGYYVLDPRIQDGFKIPK